MTENTKEKAVPMPSALSKTTETSANPLAQYFRHTKLQLDLPSAGKFYPEGSLKTNDDGTVNVMAMTARDEIIMKSPEGLLSGNSIAEMILSCIPGITDPWEMPAHDLDAILIAIRLASYDKGLEITTNCSHCSHVNEDEIDLRMLLDNIPRDGISHVHKINDMVFEFKPYTFRFLNTINKAKFDQERLARAIITEDSTDDDKSKYIDSMFKELANHNTETLVVAIDKIILPDGIVVRDKEFLTEFITSADRALIQSIRDKLTKMNDSVSIKPITMTCSKDDCKKDYETSVEFNQANFFV